MSGRGGTFFTVSGLMLLAYLWLRQSCPLCKRCAPAAAAPAAGPALLRPPASQQQRGAASAAKPEREDEAPPPGEASSSGADAGGAAAEEPSKERQEQDLVVESLDAVEDKLAHRRESLTIRRSAAAEARNFLGQVRSVAVGAFFWLVAIPARIRALARMSREDWASWRRELWEHAKDEGRHYWTGTKLLFFEIRISFRHLGKVLQGRTLTRRERQQLTRTTADVFRMVPFTIFLVVPLMEFLLPVAVKMFPNMLPSTFKTELQEKEKMKRLLQVKLEAAAFLQDTVAEMAREMEERGGAAAAAGAASGGGHAQDLRAFMAQIRRGGAVTNDQIARFAPLFNDEFTLDNLPRAYLVAMARFAGLRAYGTNMALRDDLREHLQRLKEDDLLIQKEGLSELTGEELRQACRARGMRAAFGPEAVVYMRSQLAEWLDLSLKRNLPSSLILLSKAFRLTPMSPRRPATATTAEEETLEGMRDTLENLPEEVVEVVAQSLDTDAKESAKLEDLQRQEMLIEREAQEQEQEEAEAEAEAAELAERAEPAPEEDLLAKEPAMAATVAAAAAAAAPAAPAPLTEEQKQRKIAAVTSALAVLASGSSISQERARFADLVRTEIGSFNARLAEQGGTQLTFSQGQLKAKGEKAGEAKDSKASQAREALSQSVTKVIRRLDEELDKVDDRVGDSLKLIDRDQDGIVTREEIEGALGYLREELGEGELSEFLGRLRQSDEPNEVSGFSVESLLELAEEEKEKGAAGAKGEKKGEKGGWIPPILRSTKNGGKN